MSGASVPMQLQGGAAGTKWALEWETRLALNTGLCDLRKVTSLPAPGLS